MIDYKKIIYRIGALEFIEQLEIEQKPKPSTKVSSAPFSPCMPQRNRLYGLWFIEG